MLLLIILVLFESSFVFLSFISGLPSFLYSPYFLLPVFFSPFVLFIDASISSISLSIFPHLLFSSFPSMPLQSIHIFFLFLRSSFSFYLDVAVTKTHFSSSFSSSLFYSFNLFSFPPFLPYFLPPSLPSILNSHSLYPFSPLFILFLDAPIQ